MAFLHFLASHLLERQTTSEFCRVGVEPGVVFDAGIGEVRRAILSGGRGGEIQLPAVTKRNGLEFLKTAQAGLKITPWLSEPADFVPHFFCVTVFFFCLVFFATEESNSLFD